MIVDLNIYQESSIIESNDILTLYIAQIDIVLFSKTYSVLGAPKLTVDLKKYLWDLDAPIESIKSEIISAIFSYCTLSKFFNTTCEIAYFKANQTESTRDVCVVEIIIDNSFSLKYLYEK
jgi:hypothetical protein